MRPRYIVRRPQGEQRYSVWDSENNRLAVFKYRKCVNLSFDEAFSTADRLNAETVQPKETAARTFRVMTNLSTIKERTQVSATTLGDVLYAKSKPGVPEQDWAALVESIAAGDQLALHALYERANPLVFTLIMGITTNRETAEELTVDVFRGVWRGASRYDAANNTVLGWIMNQARSAAIDRLRFETGEECPLAEAVADPRDVPTDMLRPTAVLQERLALRIANETGKEPLRPPARQWSEREWEQVAPGIQCKLLASDTEKHRVSMLVSLAPGASYPPHIHAGAEELHLLDGELWIDGRKLVPGDYNYGAPGAGDDSVWSKTGCTCVLITSTRDTIRGSALGP